MACSWLLLLFVVACGSRVESPLPPVAKPAPVKPRVVESPVTRTTTPPTIGQVPEVELAESGPVDWPSAWNVASFTLLGRDVDRSVATVISANASTIGGYVKMTGGREQPVIWHAGERVVLPMPTPAEIHTLSADGRMYSLRPMHRRRLSTIVWKSEEPVTLTGSYVGDAVVAIAHDANALVMSGTRARIFDYSTTENTFRERASVLNTSPLAVSYNARFVAGFDGDLGRVVRIDIQLGQQTIIGTGTFGAMSRDAKVFVLGDDDGFFTIYRDGKKASRLGIAGMHCQPAGISDDATRIVGHCVDGADKHAFLWDSRRGMQKLADVLAAAKVATRQRQLAYASSIDARGVTVVGTATDEDGEREAYVAIVPR